MSLVLWAIVLLLVLYLLFVSSTKFLVKKWLAEKFNLAVTAVSVGKIRFLKLSKVSIQLSNDAKLEVDSVWLSSSLFNANISTLIAVCIEEVRVQADMSNQTPPFASRQTTNQGLSMRNPSQMRLFSILPYVSIRVTNVNIILLRSLLQDCLLHFTIQDVSMSCIREESILKFAVHVQTASTKVLRRAASQPLDQQTCIIDVTLSTVFSVHLDICQGFNLLRAKMDVQSPQVLINEGFLIALKQVTESPVTLAQAREMEADILNMQEDSTNLPFVVPWQFVPDFLNIAVKHINVVVLRDSGQMNLTLGVQSIEFYSEICKIPKEQDLPEITMGFHIRDILLYSTYAKLASLQALTAKVLMHCNSIDLSTQSIALRIQYHEEIVNYWLATLRQIRAKSGETVKKKSRKLPFQASSINVKSTVELLDSVVVVTMISCPSCSLNLVKGKFLLEHTVRELTGDRSQKTNRFETRIESLSCRAIGVSEVSLDDLKTSSIYHYWNFPIFLGMLMLKVRQVESDIMCHGTVDHIHLEFCPNVLQGLTYGLKQLSKRQSSDGSIKQEALQNQHKFIIGESNMHFTNLHVFASHSNKVCVMMSTQSLNVEYCDQKLYVSQEGTMLYNFNQSGQLAEGIHLNHPTALFCHIPTMKLSYKLDHNEVNFQCFDHLIFKWNTHLHMSAICLTEDILKLKSLVRVSLSTVLKEPSRAADVRQFHVHLRVRGTIDVFMQLSKAHRVLLSAQDITANKHLSTSISLGKFTINCDDHNVFHFEELHVNSIHYDEQLKLDRESFEELELSSNKAWKMTADMVIITFPWQYNYAECHEEVINIWKWLKLMHKIKQKPFTADSPLPADLLIKVKKFTCQIRDDLFEVKLRDNYELLADEFNESVKRREMLDKKLEELKKTHLLLPSGKVEDLYAALIKKDADIYVQRSKQLSQSAASHQNLITWTLDSVEILALADLSFHGKDQVVEHMVDIDSASPYPEEGLQFTTLWCRMIRANCQQWLIHLRDYPRPMFDYQNMYIWGRLIGAEEEASKRAIRECVVEVSSPWENVMVERKMPALKFYHDFSCDIDSFTFAYGASWEPCWAQFGLCTDLISLPTKDPSPRLPYWDKQRLLLHGRLTMSIQRSTWLMHASLDPYNTTEEWEWTWTDLVVDWTNGKWVLNGDLDIYCRTASKYDDCQMFHLPNLKWTTKLDWVCLGDPNDHHLVMPCAPNKIPDYSMNKEHDSYRAFRSENLNISMSFETQPRRYGTSSKDAMQRDIPGGWWFASTLRWFEGLRAVASSITRPIRRGALFSSAPKRSKPLLGRHYKHMKLALSFHEFQVGYWMSFAKQCGIELSSDALTLCSEYLQRLIPFKDDLVRRPLLERNTIYMNCELNDGQIWLHSATRQGKQKAGEMNVPMRSPLNKNYFLSLTKVGYARDAEYHPDNLENDTPTHRLVVHDLMALWDTANRNVIFELFDGYKKAQLLKNNLSTDALKMVKVDTGGATPVKPGSSADTSLSTTGGIVATPSPMTRLQSSHVSSMLQVLVAEADSKFFAVHEEPAAGTVEQLHGVTACQTDDVLHKNWLIEMINSQVMLKGCETSGYVILSAAKTQILQRLHKPVWRDRLLYSKTTWVGSLECMQYYATVDPGETNNVRWLTIENIDEKDETPMDTVTQMVASGHSVGGVISSNVGASLHCEPEVQLQRIVSRCGCQFFFATYDEHVKGDEAEEVPPPPASDDLWKRVEGTNCFTLTHQDLNICTNSLQYAMILDIVNNLLLYVEPRKKSPEVTDKFEKVEQFEKLQSMRFQLQLSSIEDQKSPILQMQNKVRDLLLKLRRLEREIYLVYKEFELDLTSATLLTRAQNLERQISDCKDNLLTTNEELTIMISCFKESTLQQQAQLKVSKDPDKVAARNRFEICFKHAQWRLTETDGQLGISDIILRNFLYTRTTKDDDSGEHLMELAYVSMTNLLPHSLYRDLVQPRDTSGRHMLVRIYAKDKMPVGGIPIKEHFEVNVAPVTIQLTHRFYKTIMQFLFPGRNIDGGEEQVDDTDSALDGDTVVKKKAVKKTGSSSRLESQDLDDIHKMRERAAKNNLFMYIKITEVPLRVSYKGEKDKNIEDVNNFGLVMPTLEYHNQIWTWLDLVNAMKNDTKRVLLSQAIKQKILKPTRAEDVQQDIQQEEDKARMLLGARVLVLFNRPK